jgi:Glycosyltransferase family 87
MSAIVQMRWTSLVLMLLSGGASLLLGYAVGRGMPGGTVDFQGVYFGTQCLLQGCDPYNQNELQKFYLAEVGGRPPDTTQRRQNLIISLYVNLPTTFLFVAPFAMLPWAAAQSIWMILMIGSFFAAAFLIWDLGTIWSPDASLILVCILLANSEITFSTGNTAGMVIGLCVIAVWCLLQQRFVLLGILCLAISLAMKPHDAGLIWLYLILAGGVLRKRALQSLAVVAVLTVTAVFWVSHVAPHWEQEFASNMSAISGPGGLNEPGPMSVSSKNTADVIIDLQTVASVIRDDPGFYNPVTYLVGGTLLLVWTVKTLRSRSSPEMAWLALASVAPLTMLVTYHRPYDAKLLLLTIPACAILWAEGGVLAWVALLINSAALVFTGDIPLALMVVYTRGLHLTTATLAGKISSIVLTRPAPLVLLMTAIFYLCVYVQRTPDRTISKTDHGSRASIVSNPA